MNACVCGFTLHTHLPVTLRVYLINKHHRRFALVCQIFHFAKSNSQRLRLSEDRSRNQVRLQIKVCQKNALLSPKTDISRHVPRSFEVTQNLALPLPLDQIYTLGVVMVISTGRKKSACTWARISRTRRSVFLTVVSRRKHRCTNV